MKAFFVTGCGTDIGKTYITSALLRFWRAEGIKVDAFKPVLSGVEIGKDDASSLLRALGKAETLEHRAHIAPNQFVAPLSPHIAAAKEGQLLQAADIVLQCRHHMAVSAANIMLIEGAGGVAVPINNHELMLDIITQLGLDILFITGDYLGSISHSLTALHMLKSRDCNVNYIIINQSEHSVGLDAMSETIKSFSPFNAPIIKIQRSHDASVMQQPEFLHLARSIAAQP